LLAKENTMVHFIFDAQNSLEPRTRETFDEQFKRGFLPPELEEKVGQIGFADSIKEVPLQPADLYAYFWNRALGESLNSPLLCQTAEAIAKKKHHMSTFGECLPMPKRMQFGRPEQSRRHSSASRSIWGLTRTLPLGM
jgi:hypothetical protein